MAYKSQKSFLEQSLQEVKKVLEVEAQAVLDLKKGVGDDVKKTIDLILKREGKVVFTGVGKSGLVARKAAATFSSLGTSAFFVHAGEALHGDLGMIAEKDVVMAVSNSGESSELLQLLPSLRRIGVVMIALTGNRGSTLAEFADICLFTGVREEACAIGLAPTASTTAAMAFSDALAIALSKIRGFSPEDYAVYHPGGSLGKRLLTRVDDVLKIRRQNPVVFEEKTVKEALFTMTASKMGSVSVVNKGGLLVGIMTDGDIRRLLEKSTDFLNGEVRRYMTENPVSITKDKLATEALKIMEEKEINDLPAVEANRPVGMLNFQDLLRARVM